MKNTVDEHLKKIGEKISNDSFDISFITVNAKEALIGVENKTLNPCFGLSDLMSTCFQKGEDSYRVAIKESIKFKAGNKIRDIIEKKSIQLLLNTSYSDYLNQEYEPNFCKYIAHCFEFITDIDNNDENINIIVDKFIYQNNKIPSKEKKNEVIYKQYCEFCKDIHLKCSKCKEKSCENLNSAPMQGNMNCFTCKTCDELRVISDDEIFNENSGNECDDEITTHYINHIDNLDKNHLKNESIELILNYVKEFKNKLNNFFEEKFRSFLEQSAEKIYQKIINTIIEIIRINQMDLTQCMKKEGDLKSEIITELDKALKDKALQNLLKRTAVEFHKQIVEIFKKQLMIKMDEFKSTLDKNDEVGNFFRSCDVLNEKKPLKIKKEIDEYIQSLKKREEESKKKASSEK